MEIGDVVRVMTRDGRVGYIGEIVEVPASLGSLESVGRYTVRTPDDGEDHYVPWRNVQPATEAESDAYIARWVDEPEFKVGDRVEAFTSPGTWIAVEVYAVDGEWLEVGNGDPVYGPNDEIRESFRVHVRNVRRHEP